MMALLDCIENVRAQDQGLHESCLRMRRATDTREFIAASEAISADLERMRTAIYHLNVELFAAQRRGRQIERAE